MKWTPALICIFYIFCGCETVNQNQTGNKSSFSSDYSGEIQPGSWIYDKITYTHDSQSASVNLQIYFPKEYIKGKPFRTLIVLHGYRGSQKDWPNNTGITSMAERYSIVLVCPSMANTIYESAYFPETTNKWGPMPGGLFVPNVLVPYLRKKFSLASSSKLTGIFGNSTGGRGAILAAARNPEMFGVTGGVSGDYDPATMPFNRLLASVYGPYKNFEERWQNTDNLMQMAKGLNGVPVFLGHGDKDSVVGKEQSIILAVRLNELEKSGGSYPKVNKVYSYKMHDWDCWRKALPDIMNFFDENLAK